MTLVYPIWNTETAGKTSVRISLLKCSATQDVYSVISRRDQHFPTVLQTGPVISWQLAVCTLDSVVLPLKLQR